MKRFRPKPIEKLSPEGFEALFGSTSDLARLLDVPIATVGAWKARGKIPAERVPEVSKKTHIPPHRIRPDLFKQGEGAPTAA